MNLEELRTKLEACDVSLAELREKLDDPEVETEEIEARTAELLEERAGITAEIEKAEAAIAEEKRAMEDVITQTEVKEIEKREEPKKMADMEIRNTKEYIDAYAEYLKTGEDAECRALLTENASGTVPVPEMVYDIVKTAWERDGIVSRVRKAYIKGNLKVGFEISSTGATIHEEGAEVSEETLVLGTVNIVPKSIKKWVSISDEALDLRGEAFLDYIYDELAYRIAKKAADELIVKIAACGTVSTTNAVGVPKVVSTTIGVGLIADAMGLLSDEAANPVVMMNKATWSQFKAAQYAGSFDADPFEGLPVVFNNSIKSFTAATNEPYVIVGDLEQGALMNFPNGEGIDFKFDDMTLANYDLVRIIGREFVGIGVVAPDAFVAIAKA